MKKFRIQKPRHLWAMILFVISLACIAVGGNQHAMDLVRGTFLESFLYSRKGETTVLGVGASLFAGLVIWFVAVCVPEQKKRKHLRNNLSNHYRQFREELLMIFRLAVQKATDNIPSIEELQDHRKFYNFFKQTTGDGRQYWLVVVGWLCENEYYLREILREMDTFNQEIMYVRDNCGFQDEDVLNYLRHLSMVVSQYKDIQTILDDDLKPFMRFLWSIFTLWNFHDGQLEEDPIQEIIDRI